MKNNLDFNKILKDYYVIYNSDINNLIKVEQLEKFIGNILEKYVFSNKLSKENELKMIDFLSDLNNKKEELISNISKEACYNLHKKFQSSCIIKHK